MTSHAPRPDIVDRAAGLAESGALLALRDPRPEFIAGAENCRLSVLEPQDDLGLGPALRLAIARRVALAFEQPDLIRECAMPEDPEWDAMATGKMPEEPRQAAIARHVDMIVRDPARAGESDLQKLRDAGLSVPQIVALSELVAFGCFQAQLVAGLFVLGAAR